MPSEICQNSISPNISIEKPYVFKKLEGINDPDIAYFIDLYMTLYNHTVRLIEYSKYEGWNNNKSLIPNEDIEATKTSYSFMNGINAASFPSCFSKIFKYAVIMSILNNTYYKTMDVFKQIIYSKQNEIECFIRTRSKQDQKFLGKIACILDFKQHGPRYIYEEYYRKLQKSSINDEFSGYLAIASYLSKSKIINHRHSSGLHNNFEKFF